MPEPGPALTPTLSAADLLELVDLDRRAAEEGSLGYAFDAQTWTFQDRGLDHAARHGRVTTLRDAIDTHYPSIEDWWRQHPGEQGLALLHARRQSLGPRQHSDALGRAGVVAARGRCGALRAQPPPRAGTGGTDTHST